MSIADEAPVSGRADLQLSALAAAADLVAAGLPVGHVTVYRANFPHLRRPMDPTLSIQLTDPGDVDVYAAHLGAPAEPQRDPFLGWMRVVVARYGVSAVKVWALDDDAAPQRPEQEPVSVREFADRSAYRNPRPQIELTPRATQEGQ